jgi:hypothetical protein
MADQTVIRSNDLIITGNLQVSGSQITTNTDDLTVKDRLITLNKDGTLTGTQLSGIEVESSGSIIATFGYNTSSSGWDFGGANIVNAGAISTSLTNLSDTPASYTGTAGRYLKVNSGETGVEFDTLTTDDVAEGTNLYYTDGRFDTRLATKSTTNLAEGTNLYYTTGRFDTAFSGKTTTNLTEGTNLYYTDTRFDLRLATKSTTNLSEGTNLYYTTARANTDIDARIATTSVDALNDVDITSVAPATGQILMYNGANFVAQSPALGVVNTQKSSTTSVNLTGLATSWTDVAIISSFTITTNGKVEISYASNIDTETAGGSKIGLFRSINGSGVWPATPVVEYNTMTQGFPLGFTHLDDLTGSSPSVTSVAYKIAVQFNSGAANAYELSDINFTATEFKIDTPDELNDLQYVTITSQQTGQILYANSTTTWINQTPTMNPVLTSATNNLLRYNGSNWVGATPQAVAATMTLTDLGSVSSVGASEDGKLLQYDHGTSSFIWTAGIDVITEVVDDTTPQLGGDLDVQTHSIISTGANNIVLDPQGTGVVQILGNLTVTGTATTLEVTNVEVEDAIMLLNKHSTQPANNTNDGGVMVQRGTAENNAAWYWDETDDRWVAATTTNTAADVNIVATANADIQAATAYLTATQAQYADLAEIYKSDADYEPGTVVVFGGDHEVTQCNRLLDHRVAGVVSTAPAYLMNKDADGVAVALRGKVPCKVEGPVKKGDLLVTNVTPGTATTLTDDSPAPAGYCVIGKSLEDNSNTGIKLVNIVV